MENFTGRVAVVTGAASGIGLALAHRFAAAGMKVVLADIEPQALAEAVRAVGASGAETLAVRTDVSQAAEVEALAERANATFGAVHILCNNAGVALAGAAWMHTVADWEWLLGVNLWGVIHGVRVFTPLMLAQGGEAHIVNTASMAGLTCAPGMAVYNVSKHAVVALSETLHHDLTMIGSSIRVSVLCPGFVKTRILESARNRPNALADTAPPTPEREMREEMARQFLATGLQPSEVAECVFEAIRSERFYVLPHPEGRPRVRDRMMGILEDRNPTPLTIDDFR